MYHLYETALRHFSVILISVRFDHEEAELDLFTQKLKSDDKECVTDANSLGDVLDLVINTQLHSKNTTKCLHSSKSSLNSNSHNDEAKRRKRYVTSDGEREMSEKEESVMNESSASPHRYSVKKRSTRKSKRNIHDPKVFVFTLHVDKENYMVISTFEDVCKSVLRKTNGSVHSTRYDGYKEENEKIQTISHTIKYIGFSILSVMVVEVRRLNSKQLIITMSKI
jgi:flagellar biosynthesis GTPase FlhF